MSGIVSSGTRDVQGDELRGSRRGRINELHSVARALLSGVGFDQGCERLEMKDKSTGLFEYICCPKENRATTQMHDLVPSRVTDLQRPGRDCLTDHRYLENSGSRISRRYDGFGCQTRCTVGSNGLQALCKYDWVGRHATFVSLRTPSLARGTV